VLQRKIEGVDLRDPKLVVFKGRLFAYCMTGSATSTLGSLVLSSADGESFTPEQPAEGELGSRELWWVKERSGLLYGAAYEQKDDVCVTGLCSSEDGVRWRRLVDFPVRNGNEVSFDFDEEGRVWALVRAEWLGGIPTLCTLKPPYTEMETVTQLPMRAEGPMLKRMQGGCVMLLRRWNMPRRYNRRLDLFWLPDGGDVQFVRTLPSGGDTTYAGWLDLEPGRAVVSYYSSHEWKIDEPFDTNWRHNTPADIFLAEMLFR
jgi:hypothetical protein